MNKTTMALLLLGASLAAPAGAHAATVKCTGSYQVIDPSGIGVSGIRAIDLPKKTDGYAPRCLVAESVASSVQGKVGNGHLATSVNVHGARWNAGKWDCTYEERQGEYDPYQHATCRSHLHPSRRVVFDMGS